VFDHVTIRVSDRDASERFYDTVLTLLGKERTPGVDYLEWDDFSVTQGEPVTRRLHVGFRAPTHDLVDAFHRTGVEAGYTSDGEPGPRPQYSPEYYGSFLLDPDGNSIEAVCTDSRREPGQIDHVWLRVRDVAASTRFYRTIAPHAGFGVRIHGPDHTQLVNETLSFSLVAGTEPSTNVHMAFPGDKAAVEAFHAAAVAAGYRDNGAPGERPEYHPGYYAAFVLDPDGNNVEVVDHNR
jgi:catechol 2,3-dioxygenase-like lactoylglutathione lyase family enzyme